jgi:hypothetical protein
MATIDESKPQHIEYIAYCPRCGFRLAPSGNEPNVLECRTRNCGFYQKVFWIRPVELVMRDKEDNE